MPNPLDYVKMLITRALQLLERGEIDAAVTVLKEALKFLES
jgi:hypothetical protein